MAEARQAAGFRLGVSPDGGFFFEYDHDVVDLIKKSVKRTFTKHVARVVNNFKNGIFPVKFELFVANTALLTSIFMAGVDPTFGITQTLASYLNM